MSLHKLWCETVKKQTKNNKIQISPCSAFLFCSLNWYSFNISSLFSCSICSFSLSMLSLIFFSFSSRSLQGEHSHPYPADAFILQNKPKPFLERVSQVNIERLMTNR